MIKKPNKLIQYVSIALGAVLACGVFMSSTNFSLSNIVRSRASDIVDGSVTFSRTSSPASGTYDSGTYTLESQLSNGLTCVANVKGSSNSYSYAARFNATTHNITFSFKNNPGGVSHFQSITSVVFDISSVTDTASIYVYYSSDGTFSESKKVNVTYSSQTANLTAFTARYIKIANAGTASAYMRTIKINYSCDPSGEPEVRELESISVSGYKTEFTKGDAFDFGGVVTANYSNGDTENVTSNSTFNGYDMNQVGDQTVTANYLGFTTTYQITVSSSESGLAGKYGFYYSSGSYYIYIEFVSGQLYDGEITYSSSPYNIKFTYSLSGSAITLNYYSGDLPTGTTRRLFKDSSTPNIGTYDSSNDSMSLTLYWTFGGEKSSSGNVFTSVNN